MDRLLDVLLNSFLCVVVFVLVYAFLIFIPVALYTENKCLEMGYSDHRVTITLKKYCINLDGVVTNKVVEIK